MTEPGQIATSLAGALYADLKAWAIAGVRKLGELYVNATIQSFDSPAELLTAAQAGIVSNGQSVEVRCRPAPFGPFLSALFLQPFVGSRSDMRRGPAIQAQNVFLGVAAQATSHLVPVGLYPPIEPGTAQVVLYPADSPACGFVGVFPGVNELVQTISAVISADHAESYFLPVVLRGRIRSLEAADFVEAGFPPEDHEALRQAGRMWFFDATQDDARADPLGSDGAQELWGGLYATGHLEIPTRQLEVGKAVQAIANAFEEHGLPRQIVQNQAARREVMIFSQGCRAFLDTHRPFFSIHMDTEFSREFDSMRRHFDALSTSVLDNLAAACEKAGAELRNRGDLDLTYTNGTELYSVLRSSDADNIVEPVAVAIRDWHRRRGRVSTR